MRASTRLRSVLVVVLAGALVAGLFLLPTKDYLQRVLDWVRHLGVWGPVFVGAIYVPACVLFVPGSILTLGAGFLFGVVVGTVTISVGSTLGATAAFLAGRSLARGWIERKVAAHVKFQAVDRAVGRQGFKIVLLTRLSPLLPFNLLNYAFGLTRVSLRAYVLASWIGMLPGTLMYVYLGSAAKSLALLAAGEGEGGLGQQALFAAGLVVTVVVAVLVARIAKKALDMQNATVSLFEQGDPLARASRQLEVLRSRCRGKRFEQSLAESGLHPLWATGIEVLQVNLGRRCNMTCRHCHVDAAPGRQEMMTRRTARACLDALARTQIPTLDLTGGAPELNPGFRWLVEEACRLDRHVIDRSNLTILLTPAGQDLASFLARHRVEIVASLPCHLEANVDAQRGPGAFGKSIEALRRLNALGYGHADTGLVLTLMHNPAGPALPPPQDVLEDTYRRELQSRHGVVFSRLHTLTNMPVGRFLHELLAAGEFEPYMETLIGAYNPAAAAAAMCRTTLSVDWTGRLHDCDFNQMLDLGLRRGLPDRICDFDAERLSHRRVVTGPHCYGCTAGAGSSCQGATAQ